MADLQKGSKMSSVKISDKAKAIIKKWGEIYNSMTRYVEDSIIEYDKYLSMGLKPSESKDYDDFQNKLNQFNLALANFKTLEREFGPLRKMHARQTDILTLQEDKISYVLVGKNLLSDAAAGGAITSIPEVLGTQLARIEEYGISNNPESFAVYGFDVYFTDAKRSSVINLKGGSAKSDKLSVISQVGMRSWFRDLFLKSFLKMLNKTS